MGFHTSIALQFPGRCINPRRIIPPCFGRFFGKRLLNHVLPSHENSFGKTTSVYRSAACRGARAWACPWWLSPSDNCCRGYAGAAIADKGKGQVRWPWRFQSMNKHRHWLWRRSVSRRITSFSFYVLKHIKGKIGCSPGRQMVQPRVPAFTHSSKRRRPMG